jgi:hypothetical protein
MKFIKPRKRPKTKLPIIRDKIIFEIEAHSNEVRYKIKKILDQNKIDYSIQKQ